MVCKLNLKNVCIFFKLGSEENFDSMSDELHSVRPNRKLFKWENNEIPYEITIDSRSHYMRVEKIIKDINNNLKDCVQFRFVQKIFFFYQSHFIPKSIFSQL